MIDRVLCLDIMCGVNMKITRIKAYSLAMATALLAGSGCTELSRKQTGMNATVENPWQVGRAGLPISQARPGGLGRLNYGEEAMLYRVTKTDTLTDIAIKHYGDRRFTYDIYLVNGTKLKEAGGLRRGIVLKLPKMDEPTSAEVFPARP